MALSDIFAKYSRKKESYAIRFNKDDRCYEYFAHGEFYPTSKFIKEDRVYLQNINDKLTEEKKDRLVALVIAEEEKERKINERENELESYGFPCTSAHIYDNNKRIMDNGLSDYLDNVLSEEHVLYGIHRTSAPDSVIMDIMDKGLEMTGTWYTNVHNPEKVSLNENVGYYPDNTDIKMEMLYCGAWDRGAGGALLIRIPDEDLIKEKEEKAKGEIYSHIFTRTEGEAYYRLNPKYIVGYVPCVLENGVYVSKPIILREEYLKRKAENERLQQIEEMKKRNYMETPYEMTEILPDLENLFEPDGKYEMTEIFPDDEDKDMKIIR